MSADRFYGSATPSQKTGITIDVLGDVQLMELFNQLKGSQQKSVQIAAFRKAAKPLISDAKSNLQARTKSSKQGNLLKSLGTAPLRNLPILKIGARRFRQWKGNAAHLIDAGTADRSYFHKKSGKKHDLGKVDATNFWSDSVSKNETGMVRSVQGEIINSFDKLIVRYNNKAKT